jgi:trimethylamine:corrinoid methyltransferase-like protein
MIKAIKKVSHRRLKSMTKPINILSMLLAGVMSPLPVVVAV